MIKTGKKLKQQEFLIHLVIPEHQLKLSMSLDEDATEFVFFVNGRSVYALPYVYGKSFIVETLATIGDVLTFTLLLLVIDPDRASDAQIILNATVYVNDEDIVVPNPWS